MTDKTRNERLGRVLEMLEDWPSTGRPDQIEAPEGEQSTAVIVAFATSIGWIERVTVDKPCSQCGKSKPDFSFFVITPAGAAALDAAKALRAEAQKQSRRYPGTPGDDDEFEHKALDSAAACLRNDAVSWEGVARELSEGFMRDMTLRSAIRRVELADNLDRINRERTAQSLSGSKPRDPGVTFSHSDVLGLLDLLRAEDTMTAIDAIERKLAGRKAEVAADLAGKKPYSTPFVRPMSVEEAAEKLMGQFDLDEVEISKVEPDGSTSLFGVTTRQQAERIARHDFDQWLKTYAGTQQPDAMRFSKAEMQKAFEAGRAEDIKLGRVEVTLDLAAVTDEALRKVREELEAISTIDPTAFGENGIDVLQGEELEEYFADRISDSLDIDWQPRDGARSLVSSFKEDDWIVTRKLHTIDFEPSGDSIIAGEKPDDV